MGRRVREVTVQGEPLIPTRRCTVLGCEREGDPDNTVCRIVRVDDPRRVDITTPALDRIPRQTLSRGEVEGRAVATDARADLLSQVEGTSYRFR